LASADTKDKQKITYGGINMIARNKTRYSQKLFLDDGNVVVVRPFRSITLDEQVNELDSQIWEVTGKVEVAPTKKATIKGN
jgi:hypothetical protein